MPPKNPKAQSDGARLLQWHGLIHRVGLHEGIIHRLRPGQVSTNIIEVQVQVREGPGQCYDISYDWL